MKRLINYTKILTAGTMICMLGTISCKKQDNWLNVKRLNSSVVPTTLQDLQAVLDNFTVMNEYFPDVELLGTDNSYVTTTILNAATITERNSYIWAKDIYEGTTSFNWNSCYEQVEYANIALDGLKNINSNTADQESYNNVKGSALFYRSLAFYNLVQIYAKPYFKNTAATDLGIPVRLTSDVNVTSSRATVQATYDQITSDLKTCISLLPATVSNVSRPSQAAAYALLAKVYLAMQDYTDAQTYASRSLALNNSLLDYNNTNLVSPTSTYHFPTYTAGSISNPEVLFMAYGEGYKTLWPNGKGETDTLLYASYDANDLRKTLFYKNKGNNNIYYYGSYTGSAAYDFAGLAVNEVYLIRAECYARNGNTSGAMADLNTLLRKRWITGTFVPYTATSGSDALRQILIERRKELPFTEIVRWEDLRRLNLDPQYAVTVTHVYNGTTYTLPPNDERYVYPIPVQEIQIDNLPQNPR